MMSKPISVRTEAHRKDALCADREYWASNAIDVPASKFTIIGNHPLFGRPGVAGAKAISQRDSESVPRYRPRPLSFLIGNFEQSFPFRLSPL
jgi:hypothetical protein